MGAVPSVEGIDCVAGGDELLSRYGRQAADVVLIGTQRALTSGIEATRRLLAIHPSAVVIVFGSPDDTASIAAAIACGARGFLRWDATQPEIVAALADTLTTPRLPALRDSTRQPCTAWPLMRMVKIAPSASTRPATGCRSMNAFSLTPTR